MSISDPQWHPPEGPRVGAWTCDVVCEAEGWITTTRRCLTREDALETAARILARLTFSETRNPQPATK